MQKGDARTSLCSLMAAMVLGFVFNVCSMPGDVLCHGDLGTWLPPNCHFILCFKMRLRFV